jgi:hypothetical protein
VIFSIAVLAQHSMMQRYCVWTVALSLSVGGCGSNGKLAPVSGVVKLNGKPVADVEVIFQPTSGDSVSAPGPAAFGVTDAQGRYKLKVVGEDKLGASIGKNIVRFSARASAADFSEDGSKRGKPAVSIPAKYGGDTKIEFEVPSKGTSSADFQLTSP